jgi:hypothetical protein
VLRASVPPERDVAWLDNALDLQRLTYCELLAAYQLADGDLDNAMAENLFKEIERRGLKI